MCTWISWFSGLQVLMGVLRMLGKGLLVPWLKACRQGMLHFPGLAMCTWIPWLSGLQVLMHVWRMLGKGSLGSRLSVSLMECSMWIQRHLLTM